MIFNSDIEVRLVVALLECQVKRKREHDDAYPEVGMGWRLTPKEAQMMLGTILAEHFPDAYEISDLEDLVRILEAAQGEDEWTHYVNTFLNNHVHPPFYSLPQSCRAPLTQYYRGRTRMRDYVRRSRPVPRTGAPLIEMEEEPPPAARQRPSPARERRTTARVEMGRRFPTPTLHRFCQDYMQDRADAYPTLYMELRETEDAYNLLVDIPDADMLELAGALSVSHPDAQHRRNIWLHSNFVRPAAVFRLRAEIHFHERMSARRMHRITINLAPLL